MLNLGTPTLIRPYAGIDGISGAQTNLTVDGISGAQPTVAPVPVADAVDAVSAAQPASSVGGTAAASGASASGAASFSNVMGNASIGMAIGQAVGGIYAAWAGAKTAKYVMGKQAEIAGHNRQRAQLAAESVWRAAEGQIAQITYRAGQIKAQQKSAYAANGVELSGGGTAAEQMATTEVMKRIDVQTARMNAFAQAWGYKNQALQYGGQAASFSIMGNYAGQTALGSAMGSLLGGASEVADRWYKYYGTGK